MARSREARKNRRIQALRILFLVALVATVGGLVAVLVRNHLEREPPPTPPAVGPEDLEAGGETVTVGEGFERTMSEGDRALFTVRGDRYSVTRANVVHLEGVGITVYDDAGRAYEITSPEAWFQPDKREARLLGGVEVHGPDGLRAETEALFVRNRGRLITSKKGRIYIRFGDRFHARADILRVELANQRFRLFGHARVASLDESPVPFEMTTQRLTMDRSRHLLEGEGGPVWIHHRQDWLSASHVVAFLDDDEKRVQFIRADNRVVAELRSDEALGRTIEPLEAPEGFDEGDGAAGEQASAPADAGAAGEEAETAETSEAEAAGPQIRLGHILVNTAHLELELSEDGSQARELHLDGGPNGKAALRAFVVNRGPIHRLRAPHIDGTFTDGRPESFLAQEEVELLEIDRQPMSVAEEIQDELDQGVPEEEREMPAPERRIARRATARTAEATFDEAGTLATVVLNDRVRMVDHGTGEESPTWAHGDRGVFDLAKDSLTLTGIPAKIESARGTMEAPTLEYTREDGVLHGTDGVRARLEKSATSALGGTPLAQGDGPVWIEADQGFLREQPRSFLFIGSVRAWRGSDLLTADQLRGDDAEQRVHANGSVRTLWIPEKEASDAAAAGDGPLEVTSDEMELHQDERLLIYSGDVVSKQQDRIVRCQAMELLLTPEDGPSRADGGGSIEKLVCTGDVEVTDPPTTIDGKPAGGRVLTGHKAIYLPGPRTVEVDAAEDGKVTMKDRDGNVIEGPRMIYEIDQDRVQVLSRDGAEAPAKGDGSAAGEAATGDSPVAEDDAAGEEGS